MAGDGDGASSSKKRRIESLEKRIKGGGGLMGLGALAASKTKTKQQQQPHQRRGGHHRPNDDRAGGRGPGDAGFGGRGGSGGRGAAKPADGTPAHADKHRPHADKHRPHAQRRGAETPLFRGDGGGNSGPDAAWYAPIGSRTRAGVLASAHRRAYPRDLLPSGGAGRDAGTIGSAEALDDHPSDVEARRRWIRAHLRDLVATNPKAGADAEAVITSKTKDKALLLDSANGGFSVEDVAAARERRALAVGRDAKRLSGAKRKRLGTAVVPRDKARWALFHDMLHTPWCAYVAGVLEGTGGNDCEAERRLRRCELVGSVVSVVACKAPSFCGCEGIVVRDTARTIVLVTRKDDLVTVPKKGAVFAVEARAPTREKGGSDGSGGEERRVRAVLEGDSLVRSGKSLPKKPNKKKRGPFASLGESRPRMLQGALSGLAAKAKAAAAKAGDAVGDFLDNSVDNPLYEDEEAEWSDEDEEDEDLDGDEDDGTDSPAPAPTQSSALAQLRARLAAERAKKAGASVAVGAEASVSADGHPPAEPTRTAPPTTNGSMPPAPPPPPVAVTTPAPPPTRPTPHEVTTPVMTPVRPPRTAPGRGAIGQTSPGGTPIAASMSALEQRASSAEEETARLRRQIDAVAAAAETEKQRAVAAAVAEAMEREQRKAAAMMEAMVEADGASNQDATIDALRTELTEVRTASTDAQAELETLRRRVVDAEAHSSAMEEEARAARAGEDDNCAEAEDLRHALAGERSRTERMELDLEARDIEIEKNQKELVRLRHHLLELEEEDDAKAETFELNAEALVREREEEHAARMADLTAQLAAAERELEFTRGTVDAKDRELANLQVAMEMFNADEEARGRMSLESSALREKNAHLSAELSVAKEQVTAANTRASAAEEDAKEERGKAEVAVAEMQRAIVEAGKARAALQQSAQQAKLLMDTSTELLDKRIVSKLLLTYFEREQSPDVLELMARMLNMSETEKAKMGLGEQAAPPKPGLIRSVATAPVRVAFGALGFAGNVAKTALQTPVHVARVLTPEQEKQTIVDQWVDFLISQMDQEDEDEIAGKKFKVQPVAAAPGS